MTARQPEGFSPELLDRIMDEAHTLLCNEFFDDLSFQITQAIWLVDVLRDKKSF